MQKWTSYSYEQTVALGEQFGKTLQGGTVVALYGGMGAGKTAFITGIAKGMGITHAVSSPTFSIVQVYGKHAELCHFDMYRVETWDDLETTGFFEYLESGSVLCVEWSENIENALPENTVRITMERGDADNVRIITVTGAKENL